MAKEGKTPKVEQRSVTEEDLSMLTYYWEKAEDLDRFACLPEIKQDLKRNYPATWKAWKQYKKAKEILSTCLRFY
jgi:hypothetical protein